MREHYLVLGVPVTANFDEIKKAYYHLMVKTHPDKNAEDAKAATEKSQAINAAYEALSNWYQNNQSLKNEKLNANSDEFPEIDASERPFLRELYRGKNNPFPYFKASSPHNEFDIDLYPGSKDNKMLGQVALGKQLVNEVSKSNWRNFDSFIERGCSVIQKSDEGKALAHYAVLHNKLRQLKKIYDKKIEQHPFFNQQDGEGKTPLHLAVEMGRLDLVELLILCGAAPDIQDKNGDLALHLAIRELQESKKKRDLESEDCFHTMALYLIYTDQLVAEKDGSVITIKRFKGSRVEVNKDGHTPLSLALEGQDFWIANELSETQKFFNEKEIKILGDIKKKEKMSFFSGEYSYFNKKNHPSLSLSFMKEVNKKYLKEEKQKKAAFSHSSLR